MKWIFFTLSLILFSCDSAQKNKERIIEKQTAIKRQLEILSDSIERIAQEETSIAMLHPLSDSLNDPGFSAFRKRLRERSAPFKQTISRLKQEYDSLESALKKY